MPTVAQLFTHKNFVALTLENSHFDNFMVTFERTPKGFLLDWPSYVGYGEMSLAELQSQKPKNPVLMRFLVRDRDYYNLEFSEDKKLKSYELATQDNDRVIYGYALRESAEHSTIAFHARSKPTLFCVLKVKFPENSSSDRQVEIVEFVQNGWVLREDDAPFPTTSSKDIPMSGPSPELAKPPASNGP